jgi:hypothetical protein
MGWPPFPGPGHYPLTLATPGFALLLLLLGTFGTILFLLHRIYPGRQRALDGFFEAASIDLGFLIFGFVLVVALVASDAHANRTSVALYRTVLDGYWYTFSIPVVTVATSVEDRSRGSVRWKVPSLLASALLFGALFAFYFATA